MNRIEYIATDDKRQVIPYVRLTDGTGHRHGVLRRGRDRRGLADWRAACARLRRLPQPPVAHVRVLGRARRRRRDRRRRVRREDAVHPAGGRQGAEGRVRRQGGAPSRGSRTACGPSTRTTPMCPRRRSTGPWRRRRHVVRAQRVPLDERDLGHLREQRRTQRPRAQPLPRVLSAATTRTTRRSRGRPSHRIAASAIPSSDPTRRKSASSVLNRLRS